MTLAIAVHGSGFGWDLFGYEPITNNSRKIQRAWAQEQNYLRGSASDWMPIVDAALRCIRNDCTLANWDGSGALPMPEGVINLTADIAKVLFTLLPSGTPAPDFIPEADGEICMSWSIDAKRLFSLSIGIHNKINFAGQFGMKGGIHGWQPIDTTNFDNLEKSLQETAHHISRLFPLITSGSRS
jgi:hypothetical protein